MPPGDPNDPSKSDYWGGESATPPPAGDVGTGAPSGIDNLRIRPGRRSPAAPILMALVALAAVTAVVIVFASSPSRPSVSQFDAQVAAICNQGATAMASVSPASATGEVPYGERIAVAASMVRRLAALTPPSSEATAYSQYIGSYEQALAVTRQIVNDEAAGHDAAAIDLEPEVQALERSLAEGQAAGVGCGAASARTVPSPDASAKELARTAETTIETYATDHSGSYAGITPAILQQYEPSIPIAPGNGQAYVAAGGVTALDGGTGYMVTTTATTGDTFTIERAPNGPISRTCTTAPGNSRTGCPASGQW
ncbi:MAG: hypothetical protein ABSG64_05565 [Solirubrobacteraceae bacterium]|jgi:hypothetical protein